MLKYCSELNNVLTFFPEEIRSCNVFGENGFVYFNDYDGNIKNFDFQSLKDMKRKYFDDLTCGNLENLQCDNCLYLTEKTEKDTFSEKFSVLFLNNWYHCNCGCIYCDRLFYTKGKIHLRKKKSEYYDVLPIVKGLYKNNLLDTENLRVVFHGGDLAVLKEFEPLVKLFLKNGVQYIIFATNNIIYQPLISKCIKANIADLNVSLDAGTRETFKKIKRLDKFNDVIKNLRRYVKESKQDIPSIKVMYIILRGINDNEEEITNFINLMSEIGVKKVTLLFEHRYSMKILENKVSIPENYKNLINLFYDLCEKKQLITIPPDKVMEYVMSRV